LDGKIPDKQKDKDQKNTPEDLSSFSGKKKSKQKNDKENRNASKEQCKKFEQNKAGIDELPDSFEYLYNIETKTAKQALRKVWKNPKAKKEVLAGLGKMDRGELVPRNQKDFKGFKTLKEIKLNKTRMLVNTGKKGAPDEIVAIFLRRDIDDIANNKNFKNTYN
jgi:hypothetical protein